MRIYNWLFALFLFLSMGCAASHYGRYPLEGASGKTNTTPATDNQKFPEYRFGFGDVIEVKFFRNEQFNETVKVRPDGRISLEKVGELNVTGMTPFQLDTVLTRLYGSFIRNPDITVIVREFGGYQVYVLGEVAAPGGFEIQRNMTILQALAVAGGPKVSAKLNSVIVLRRERTNDISAFRVDLTKPMKPKYESDVLQNDIFIQPQDVVYVPKTFIANVSTFMKQVYDGVLPPVDLYLRALLFYN